ncbi:hypothetical protein QBC42DRAFT_143374, partial [Cladorrhinum samala]
TKGITTVSWPMPAHECSHPPAETRPICSTLPAAEDYCPSVCSDDEHNEDDIVRPPPHKRRSGDTMTIPTGGTASQQQTRLSCGDSSKGVLRSSRHPRRQRGAAHPPSSLEKDIEMARTPTTTFEE